MPIRKKWKKSMGSRKRAPAADLGKLPSIEQKPRERFCTNQAPYERSVRPNAPDIPSSGALSVDAFRTGAGRACREGRGTALPLPVFYSSTSTVVPFPTWLRSSILPPRYCTACFTMESPSPVPPVALERLLSTR